MKNSIRIIFGYLFLFIESLIFLAIILLTIFKFTLFDSNYVKNTFEKNDYYKKLTAEIKTEMSYYTNQSGFEDTILDNVFSESDVQSSSEKFIDSLYSGTKFTINTKTVEDNLNKNIEEYLNNENFKITNSDEIKKFVDQMIKIYGNEIKLMGYVDSVGGIIHKVVSNCNTILLFLVLNLILLVVINLKLLKRKDFSVIFYTSSILLLFVTIYIRNSIDINNISIYSELVSGILKSLVKTILNIILISACSSLIVGLIIDILKKERHHHRRHYE